MSEIIRFGISMDSTLLGKFDQLIGRKGYTNRAEAMQDLIRDSLVQAQCEAGSEETLGTITIVYSQQTRELSDVLTHLQHRYYKSIVSTTHIHLDDHNCLEVLIVRGKGNQKNQRSADGDQGGEAWKTFPNHHWKRLELMLRAKKFLLMSSTISQKILQNWERRMVCIFPMDIWGRKPMVSSTG